MIVSEPMGFKNGHTIAVTTVIADRLAKDMFVTNVGRVLQIERDGVFVTAWVQGTTWDTFTGQGVSAHERITWHESNEIAIDVS